MGRPWPRPGEPLFLKEDSDLAIALAEEERDTCPSCGMPKAWCRDPANQFAAFEAHEEQCHATYALLTRKSDDKATAEKQKSAQVSVRFAEGKAPDILAGLDLARGDQDQQGD